MTAMETFFFVVMMASWIEFIPFDRLRKISSWMMELTLRPQEQFDLKGQLTQDEIIKKCNGIHAWQSSPFSFMRLGPDSRQG